MAANRKDDLQTAIGKISWFHSIDMDGAVTPGLKPYARLRKEAGWYFSEVPLTGKSVLDIGAWDGFMSFEAERRGAARVVATDHFCWNGAGWGTKAGFDLAKRALASRVEELEVDVFDLDPAKHGMFDVVLFPGVLYHLTDPWGGLKKAADMTKECLIVETATALNHVLEPAMRYYLGAELGGDPTNFWAPNALALKHMLLEMGFIRVSTSVIVSDEIERLVAHGWR